MPGLRTLLARFKRRLLKKPFHKDRRYPAFWFGQALGPKPAFIVQIGSNDGKTGDPLYALLQQHLHWRALFVEPVPASFAQLQQNYPDQSRFTFENVAINEGKRMTFYSVDPQAKHDLPDLPYWFDQLGSFDRQHILKHFDGALEPYLQATELEGISLSALLERNKIKQIDILHIDTEGYDWNILSQLDLSKYQPDFILFEHHHLHQEELRAADQFLRPDYELFNLGIDTLGVKRPGNEQLITEMSKHLLLGT